MPQANVVMHTRHATPTTSIIDIQGDISAFAEQELMRAYNEANTPKTRTIILNFTGLEYMNSSGIGLIVTLLIRINRQKQRMLAFGLSDHYQHIFELTRLNDAIKIFDSEAAALAAVQKSRILLRRSQPRDALVAAQRAVALQPENLLTQMALGDAQTAAGDKNSARAAYELALAAAHRLESDAQPLFVPDLEKKLRP